MKDNLNKKNCDIFCRVIDNFGDIGVCWRLARQLQHEYDLQVRLWLDDIHALKKIWPATHILDSQIVDGIEICVWNKNEQNLFAQTNQESADIVIEAFACHLPDIYLQLMREKKPAPDWFNLEYLSAEAWIEDIHGLTSPHPITGMKKFFFFPGFTNKTGVLIREKNLIAERDDYLQNKLSRVEKLNELGITCSEKISSDAFWISLFAYENSSIVSLMQTWIKSKSPIVCLVPEGKILSSITPFIGKTLAAGDEYHAGQLTLKILPFVQQTEFDRILWLCDCNFVRGEDSLVRAQWAGKPFVWHIYPQDDEIHLDKLTAFLNKFVGDGVFEAENSQEEFLKTLRSFWLGWNQGQDVAEDWNKLMNFWPLWQKHTRNWSHKLIASPDLAKNLLSLCCQP